MQTSEGLVILQSLQKYRPRISDTTIITKIGINLNKQTHGSHDGYSMLGNPDYNNIVEHRNKPQIACTIASSCMLINKSVCA